MATGFWTVVECLGSAMVATTAVGLAMLVIEVTRGALPQLTEDERHDFAIW